ncbi:MAG: hypothetical protein AAFR52_16985 [Pseudomonadota bacterium]
MLATAQDPAPGAADADPTALPAVPSPEGRDDTGDGAPADTTGTTTAVSRGGEDVAVGAVRPNAPTPAPDPDRDPGTPTPAARDPAAATVPAALDGTAERRPAPASTVSAAVVPARDPVSPAALPEPLPAPLIVAGAVPAHAVLATLTPATVPAGLAVTEAPGEGARLEEGGWRALVADHIAPSDAAPLTLAILPPRRPVPETPPPTRGEATETDNAPDGGSTDRAATDRARADGAQAGTDADAAALADDAAPAEVPLPPAPPQDDRSPAKAELDDTGPTGAHAPRAIEALPPPRPSGLATAAPARQRAAAPALDLAATPLGRALGEAASEPGPGETAALIGVMVLDGQRQALMRIGAGRYHRVSVGDRLAGWTVLSIAEDTISLSRGNRAETLRLLDE